MKSCDTVGLAGCTQPHPYTGWRRVYAAEGLPSEDTLWELGRLANTNAEPLGRRMLFIESVDGLRIDHNRCLDTVNRVAVVDRLPDELFTERKVRLKLAGEPE